MRASFLIFLPLHLSRLCRRFAGSLTVDLPATRSRIEIIFLLSHQSYIVSETLSYRENMAEIRRSLPMFGNCIT